MGGLALRGCVFAPERAAAAALFLGEGAGSSCALTAAIFFAIPAVVEAYVAGIVRRGKAVGVGRSPGLLEGRIEETVGGEGVAGAYKGGFQGLLLGSASFIPWISSVGVIRGSPNSSWYRAKAL